VPSPFPVTTNPLYRLEDSLAELTLHLLALLIGSSLAVQSHQRTQIELRLLQELDLADVDLSRVSII
jgi:hypothetical protein